MQHANTDIRPVAKGPFEHPDWHPVFQLLRQVTFARDQEARFVELADFLEMLRFCSFTNQFAMKFMMKALDLNGRKMAQAPASRADYEAIMTGDHSQQGKLRFSEEVATLLHEMQRYEVFLTINPVFRSAERIRMTSLYRQLLEAAEMVPGQTDAASAAATHLALQLVDKKRTTPACLLLHGPHGSGTDEMAVELAKALQYSGYDLLEMDCSQFRSNGEASSWDGSKSYWSGSKPGIITSFIHKHPKGVVIFHGIDRTLPKVMEALRGALISGIMVDNYGLENEKQDEQTTRIGTRPPTPVNCREAIFLFTAETGAEWYQHPDLRHVMERENSVQNTIREAMFSATQEHHGERILAFDLPVLKIISEHMALLRPPTFHLLLNAASKNLEEARQAFEARFSCELRVDEPEAVLKTHLLCVGGNQGLAATTIHSLEQNLLAPLMTWLIRNDAGVCRVRLGLSKDAARELAEIYGKMGENPMEYLHRKCRNLRFQHQINYDPGSGGEVRVCLIGLFLEKVLSLDDFNGEVIRLNASVPEIKLDNVSGHEPVKHFFLEMINYLHQQDQVSNLEIDLPKGALLYGPPGTGKTMLAQAFAGEAELPFIAVAGTDLLHSERVRELYSLAKRNAPCVIFVDEADALGTRGENSSVHDAALNKLLTEIQGFSSTAPIFHILATNRVEVLDQALTRSGRIDRRFFVGPLDRDARSRMIDKLLVMTKLDSGEHRDKLLSYSQGLTGSELRQVQRECGLRILRTGSPVGGLSVDGVLEEITSIKFGNKEVCAKRLPEFRRRVAIHEVGHALIHALLLPEIPLNLVTITPREGGTEGFISLDAEGLSHFHETSGNIKKHLCVLMGGRAAEMLDLLDDGRSSGAAGDLAHATAVAFRAVARSGLDEEFGLISLAGFQRGGDIPPFLADKAWRRAAHWLREAEARSLELLRANWPVATELTTLLLEKEYLDGGQVVEILQQTMKQELRT